MSEGKKNVIKKKTEAASLSVAYLGADEVAKVYQAHYKKKKLSKAHLKKKTEAAI